MPRNVLHLLGTAEPEGTGIVRFVGSLARGLNPSRYCVHAWFLGPPGPLIEDLRAAGVDARSLYWQLGARDPVGTYRFWRALHKIDVAIVHQHFGGRAVRALIRAASRARLVVHLHGRVLEPNHVVTAPTALPGVDAVIAVSYAVASCISVPTPIVVYAGVEQAPEPYGEESLRGEHPIIGTACRLVPLKGLLHLLQAVADLVSVFPTLRLEIAGSGPQRQELEKECARLGIGDRVCFLGWRRDLGPSFRRWDIFAVPSLEEGFGMAALEAMEAGLPVVAAAVGGLPELIEDGRTGYLVPPSDVAALAGRLRMLLLEPERRRTVGAAAQAKARNRFSAVRMVAEIGAVYDGLLC